MTTLDGWHACCKAGAATGSLHPAQRIPPDSAPAVSPTGLSRFKEGSNNRAAQHRRRIVIRYKEHFRKFTEEYFGDIVDDCGLWLWFAAQGAAESGFEQKAKSPVGALGVMQIMPATWREITYSLRHLGGIFNAESNIEAGIWYDRFCWDRLGHFDNWEDRMMAMFAAYNCGLGRVKKLIARHNPVSYADLELHIAYVETVNYVKRIRRLHKEYLSSELCEIEKEVKHEEALSRA